MKEKIYIGIDPSLTGTGVYCSDGTFKLIKTTNKDCTEERILKIWKEISEIYNYSLGNKEMVVAIEGFSFGSRGAGMAQLFGLGWYLRVGLYKFKDCIVYEIPPNSWKKFLFHGQKLPKGAKDLLMLETYKQYNVEITDNNLCDAFNLMKCVKAYHEWRETGVAEFKWQEDIFKNLHKRNEEDEAKKVAGKSQTTLV